MRKICTIIILINALVSKEHAIAQKELLGVSSGGDNCNEAIFKAKSVDKNLVDSFTSVYVGEGKNPTYTQLCEASGGKLYGVTTNGGIGLGVLFEYDTTTNTYTKKINFTGGTNGAAPYGGLILASNGKLYGMTSQGGNGFGNIYEFDPSTSIYTNKFSFTIPNGITPFGSLVQAKNGKFYGMTRSGGTNDLGVLFEYDVSIGAYNKIHDFNSIDGTNPYGSLIQATNNKLYGLTQQGGINDAGVLFEYDLLTNTYTKRVNFSNITGNYPVGSLIQATNGKLYGMTGNGGASNAGVIFEYDIMENTYLKRYVFDEIDGSAPSGNLTQANNGKLYGMTDVGGMSVQGVLFEYDLSSSTFRKRNDLDLMQGTIGSNSLLKTSSGGLYGLTSSGGVNNAGVIFKYDYISNIYAKKLDFDASLPDVSVIQNSISLTANDAGASYQWIDCNNGNSVIVGETNQSFTASANGNYAVVVTKNSCIDTSSCHNITGVSINDSDRDVFRIYPNPTSGEILIDFGQGERITKIFVRNCLSRIVYHQETEYVAKKSILIPGEIGMYFVEIYTGEKVTVLKLIKE